MKKTANVVVCVSEGIADAGGTFICEYSDAAKLDSFGHKMLTGCGEVLESFVRDRFHVKVRSIELNVSQRCSGMLASRTDIEESAMAGAFESAPPFPGKQEKWQPSRGSLMSPMSFPAAWSRWDGSATRKRNFRQNGSLRAVLT